MTSIPTLGKHELKPPSRLRPDPETLEHARKTWVFLYEEANTSTDTLGNVIYTKDFVPVAFPRRKVLQRGEESESEAPDYILEKLLGRGGMGEVWQATQPALKRAVALKLSHSTLRNTPLEQSRLAAEARITSALKHPHIVVLHEIAITQDNVPFYVMQENVGALWSHILQKSTREQNLCILEKVAHAVAFAHSRGIIHRDIKPSNVLIGEHGDMVLSDWGLALSVFESDLAPAPAPQNSLAGTPAYMAPEMALGTWKDIGFTADVYLLGAVLFEILTGKPPHYGKDTVSCLTSAAHNKIDRTNIAGPLMAVAYKAMSAKPQDRYPNAKVFIEAFTNARKHEAEHNPRHIIRKIRQTGWWGIVVLVIVVVTFVTAFRQGTPKPPRVEALSNQTNTEPIMTISDGETFMVGSSTTAALEATKHKLGLEIKEMEKQRKLTAYPSGSPADTIRRYLETYSWRDRLKYILNAETVTTNMEKYYDRPGNRTRVIHPLLDMDVVRESQEPDKSGYIKVDVNYTVYDVAIERRLSETYWLKQENGVWKIDWEKLSNSVMR